MFKKVQKVIQFNQEEWLKPYIALILNQKKRKNDFGKIFLN